MAGPERGGGGNQPVAICLVLLVAAYLKAGSSRPLALLLLAWNLFGLVRLWLDFLHNGQRF